MRTIPFLIAQRYIFTRHHEKNIATMILICSISIVISTFSLALVGAIMNGFETTTQTTLQSIHAPIIMSAYGEHLNVASIKKVLRKEFPMVKAIAPRDTQHALIYQNHKEEYETPYLISVMGIDPLEEVNVTALHTKMKGGISLSVVSSNDGIVMGETMAKNLDIKPGDTVTLWIAPAHIESKTITLQEHTVKVLGLFNTGVEEFDDRLVICSLPLLEKIFPDAGVTQIGISLNKPTASSTTINQLRQRFTLDVYSWKDLYPALVAALTLEKYAMIVIFALIMLIASTTIIALLFVWITDKKTDIALFKIMGMTDGQIRTIFFSIGMGIIVSASLLGIGSAWCMSYIINTYKLISLPDAYYVSYLPADLNGSLIIMISGIIIVIGTLALILPLRSLRYIKILDVLRFVP